MKQTDPSRSRPSYVAGWIMRSLLLGAPWGAAAFAADVPLPPLEISVTPASQQVTIEWDEVPTTVGRQVSNITYVGWDDANSSDVLIEGEYALDCDYRLRVSKIPQDPGFGRRVLLVLQLFENVTGVARPAKEDTLHVLAPDSPLALDPAFAANLSLAVTGNVNPPDGPLGTIPITASGLNTTSSPTAGYFATALNTVTDLSQGLQVEVTGPVDLNAIPDPLPPGLPTVTLLVTSPAETFAIMDGMSLSFGNGAASPGDTTKWTANYLFPPSARVLADLEAFEGYHLWRSDLPDVDSFTLLGEIEQCESKFDFILVDEDDVAGVDVELQYDPVGRRFAVVDRDIHDDFPYRYAVSTYDRGFLGNLENLTFEGPLSTTGKLYPALPTRDATRGVFVVPNPFRKASAFQERGPKIVFANLPTECTIRVFTESANHLATLSHGPGVAASTSPTSREWDLRTDRGNEIVPGIYIFHINGTNRVGGSTVQIEDVGKFIIVK